MPHTDPTVKTTFMAKHPHATATAQTQENTLPASALWGIPLVFGILLPAIIYGVLPMVGIDILARLLSLKGLAALTILAVGSVAYIAYFKHVLKKPHWLVFFMLMGWGLFNYANDNLMLAGVNIRFRLLIMLVFTLPGTWLVVQHGQQLLKTVSHFKYYILFFAWLTLYFFFYNSHAIDPEFMGTGGITAGAVDIIQITGYYYCLLATAVSAIAMKRHSKPGQYFDQMNTGLFVVSGLISIYTIVGYPLLLTSEWIDGFQRANGLFSHPNPFAHHMGIILVYQLGMLLFYQGVNKRRVPGWILVSSLGLNMAAFLLAMSKTAIGVLLLCAFVLFMANLASPLIKKHLPKIILGLLVIVPAGIWTYQAVTDQSFFSVLQSRLDVKHSMVWRQQIWEYLVSNINGWWILTGHGFTDANSWVHQLTYNTETNAKPLMMVHNGYIGLLYDLGIMGLVLFVSVISQFKHSLKAMFTRALDKTAERPLHATIVALSLYFLVVCGFDEMTYMFDAPIFFWVLSTTLFCLLMRARSDG